MDEDYYRFESEQTIGLINSPICNVAYDKSSNYALSGALDTLLVWNIRTAQIVSRFSDPTNKHQITIIVPNPKPREGSEQVAVGYTDGSIRIWDMTDGLQITFHGHKNHITTLAWDPSRDRLASGSRDCDIILWDLASEVGLFRLIGHENAVSRVLFVDHFLISVSKDTFLKVWDLRIRHCIETFVDHHCEIIDLVLCDNVAIAEIIGHEGDVGHDQLFRLASISSDNLIRVLSFNLGNATKILDKDQSAALKIISCLETVTKSSKERAMAITIDKTLSYLLVNCVDKSLEIWSLLTPQGWKQRLAKSKSKKKANVNPSWLKHMRFGRLASKSRSLEFSPLHKIKDHFELLAGFVDNQIGKVMVPLDNSQDIEIPIKLDQLGHRSECKSVRFSNDGSSFATISRESIKLWNSMTGTLTKTVQLADATQSLFIDDDSILIVTDKNGFIHLVQIASGDVVESKQIHDGSINAIALRPDGRAMMTGGADKCIKFWEFKKQNTFKMTKTLALKDEIIALKYSPDSRLIAASTMDLTVKIFFADSLKFFISLYGHKLPVTDFDICHESKILISCSADKNIKIWSLEFGDCRKSVFAHEDAITTLAFLPQSKLFLTASKDGSLKFWDSNKPSSELQKMQGHFGEVWHMAINNGGGLVVSVSADRSIKIWASTSELLFPVEEEERQFEEKLEESLLEENPHEESNKLATKKTISSMKAGERIVDFIEAADDYRRALDEHRQGKERGVHVDEPSLPALMLALGRDKTPSEFVFSAFERVPVPDIAEALLCLPNMYLPSLVHYIDNWLDDGENIILVSRIIELLVKLFQSQLIALPALVPTIVTIRDKQKASLYRYKKLVGFNNAAITLLKFK